MSAHSSQLPTEERGGSLGPLFSAVSSRVLRKHLFPYLDIPDLLALTQTCWTFFVHGNEETLWRDRCLRPPYIDAENKRSRFTFNGSWKHTVCAFYFGAARWLSSQENCGKTYSDFGSVNSANSLAELQSCTTIAEASVRFNVLLPRIVTCLYRDGILSTADNASWCRRFRAHKIKNARSILVNEANAEEDDAGAIHDTLAACASSSDELALQHWQESVVGKPCAPLLAQHYLQLSIGAINYFVTGGFYLRPPTYALKRGQHRACRAHTEFTDHNWLGACLLDLVPLPHSCSIAQFMATMMAKMQLEQHGWKGCESVIEARTSSSSSLAAMNVACRAVPDEQRGVRGVVDRRYQLSVAEFRAEYEQPNIPVVLTGCIEDWRARQTWQGIDFFKRFGEEVLKANGRTADGRRFRMHAADYVAYATSANAEKPMYIFDKKILAHCALLRDDYAVPAYFQEDLFACMDEEERPDYRWVLVGPDGSGTPFHTDPHGSSAWNAVLSGCKRVTFYPPHVVPPGVEEEWIHSDYYASEPYLRWYRERSRDLPDGDGVRGHFCEGHAVGADTINNGDGALLPVEALVFPGDVVFIPSGWWHQVLNIGFTAAVTQNFCSSVTFPRVVADMNAYADRQVRKDFQRALRRAGRDELAVQLRVPSP